MKRLALTLLLLTAGISFTAFAGDVLSPDRTLKYASRDTCDLYLDIYEPAPGSASYVPVKRDGSDGPALEKPTVVFIFGGGFFLGSRNSPFYDSWFRILTENGYRVVSIDYRLALKGKKLRIPKDRATFLNAVDVAVEDLYSATYYLIENGQALGIDPGNLVIMGSSAGALTALSADWYLSNRTSLSSTLPEGFRYKGVISLSGAIISDHGKPAYPHGASPTMLLHGDRDAIVMYKGIRIFNWGLFGSVKLSRIFEEAKANYQFIRYKGHAHDVASAFVESWGLIRNFLERNVMEGQRIVIDAYADDPSFASDAAIKAGALYD